MNINSFRELHTQSTAAHFLQHALGSGHISHAYLFSGEKGSGKRDLAELFAKTILCGNRTEGEDTEPCGRCVSCRKAESGNHPDILYVQHEKPGVISVDEIRTQVVETATVRPYESAYKVYIIEDADLMNPQAQNALLKTLEEPAPYVVILLLTENKEALLPTILSRCVVLDLHRGGEEIPEEVTEEALQLIGAIPEMNAGGWIAALQMLTRDKQNINSYLDVFTKWYRDVLLFKATKDADSLIYREYITQISRTAKHCSYEGIEEVLAAIETAGARLRANVNFEVTMELLFLAIREKG